MVKRILKYIGIGVAVLVLVAAGVAVYNWSFIRNLTTFPQETAIASADWYKPLETVKGAETPYANLTTSQTPSISSEALAAAQSYSDEHNGLTLIVFHNDEIQFESYTDGMSMSARTMSRSMHKSVLALVVGAALEDGILSSVDDPVGNYISEWEDTPEGEVALRSLLQMAAGYNRFGFTEWNGLQFNFGRDISGTALKITSARPADEVFAYNNIASQILGIVLERAIKEKTGLRYAEYLSQKIWAPLGNADGGLWLDRKGGAPRYYSGLQAATRDWMNIGRLYLNAGNVDGVQILPAAWIADVTTPSPLNPNYGYQTWLGAEYESERDYGDGVPLKVKHSAPYGVDDMVFFDGFGGQRVYASPSLGLVIARTGETSLAYDDAIIPNLIIEDILANQSSAETEE